MEPEQTGKQEQQGLVRPGSGCGGLESLESSRKRCWKLPSLEAPALQSRGSPVPGGSRRHRPRPALRSLRHLEMLLSWTGARPPGGELLRQGCQGAPSLTHLRAAALQMWEGTEHRRRRSSPHTHRHSEARWSGLVCRAAGRCSLLILGKGFPRSLEPPPEACSTHVSCQLSFLSFQEMTWGSVLGAVLLE